jgi:hypothetical protein
VECGSICSEEDSFIIDSKNVCNRCLFGDISPVKIYPIGFVSNKQERDNSDFGLDGKEVGVFASRTPDRLSRIGIQDVRLVKVEGTTLVVKGLDAINGTPVLDIKLKRKKLCPFI